MSKGKLVGRGGRADVYGWGPDRVLKLFKPRFASSADLEVANTRAARAAGVRVPEVFERVQIEGREGFVLERIEGPSLLEAPRREGMDVYERLARIHADVHACTSAALPSGVQRLQVAIERFPAQRAALEERAARIPPGTAVCHGLFHPGHVLLARSGPVIIDWPDAFCGPPAWDVARTAVFLRYVGVPSPFEPFRRRPQVEDYVAAYLARSIVTMEEVRACLPLAALVVLLQAPRHPERALLEIMAELD